MKKKHSFAILALAALAGILSASCQREEILYPTSNYYVGITVTPDEREPNYKEPTVYVASFYEAETGRLARRRRSRRRPRYGVTNRFLLIQK